MIGTAVAVARGLIPLVSRLQRRTHVCMCVCTSAWAPLRFGGAGAHKGSQAAAQAARLQLRTHAAPGGTAPTQPMDRRSKRTLAAHPPTRVCVCVCVQEVLLGSLNAPARVTLPRAPPHTLLLADCSFSDFPSQHGERARPSARRHPRTRPKRALAPLLCWSCSPLRALPQLRPRDRPTEQSFLPGLGSWRSSAKAVRRRRTRCAACCACCPPPRRFGERAGRGDGRPAVPARGRRGATRGLPPRGVRTRPLGVECSEQPPTAMAPSSGHPESPPPRRRCLFVIVAPPLLGRLVRAGVAPGAAEPGGAARVAQLERGAQGQLSLPR